MRIWLSLSFLMSVQGLAAESLDDWQEHKRGSLAWSARGVIAPEEGLCQHPSVDCRKMMVEVRNDRSDAPIYCGASLQFPQPNAYSMPEKGWQNWVAVEPGKTVVVNYGWLPKDLEVKKIHTECHPTAPVRTANAIIDVTDRPPPPRPPPPPTAPGCSTRIKSVANPDDYYPAAAKAEGRTGAPVIRVTVKKGQTSPDTVTLVTSSDHADIDEAAVQVANVSRYGTDCEVGSVAFKVKFAIH